MGGDRQTTTFWLYSRWFLIGGTCVFIFLAIGFGRAWYGQYKVHQEILQLKNEAARLEAKRLETVKALEYAASSGFVEAKARTEFNMVKPGENVAVVEVPGTSSRRAPGQAPTNLLQSNAPPESNFAKWWRYFFGKF